MSKPEDSKKSSQKKKLLDSEESKLEEALEKEFSEDEIINSAEKSKNDPKKIKIDENKFREFFRPSESASPSLGQAAISQETKITNLESSAMEETSKPKDNKDEDDFSYLSKQGNPEEKKYFSYGAKSGNQEFLKKEDFLSKQNLNEFERPAMNFNPDSRIQGSNKFQTYDVVSKSDLKNFEKDSLKKSEVKYKPLNY